jgi:hypothetical protein
VSKGSKRPSWRTQQRTYNDITRQIAQAADGMVAPIPPDLSGTSDMRMPPNAHERVRLRKLAEVEAQRQRVREVLAAERAAELCE